MFCSLYLIFEICKPLWGWQKGMDSVSLFQEEKLPADSTLCKKCPFPEKLFFLNLNQKCQKQLLIRGIQPLPAPLAYPSALLSNKGAVFMKRKALFQEQF